MGRLKWTEGQTMTKSRAGSLAVGSCSLQRVKESVLSRGTDTQFRRTTPAQNDGLPCRYFYNFHVLLLKMLKSYLH